MLLRVQVLLVCTLALWPTARTSFAASSGRGGRKPRGGGSGFGKSTPPSAPGPAAGKRPKKKGAPSSALIPDDVRSRTASLEQKLREQHAANCAKAAQLWATCSDANADGTYTGGWESYSVPREGVSPGNEPYGTDRLLLKSRGPLLSAAVCQELIDRMEAHGATHGWDSRYPVGGFTREVNVADIPESVALLNGALESTILPAAAAEFLGVISPSELRVNEALVVKYDAATGNNCLPVHQDFSLLTINVALSERGSFTGGGTWFQHSAETLVVDRGEAVMHAGAIPHCGVPVESGVRYQLVLFLLSERHPDVAGRLQAIGAAAGAKKGGTERDNPLLDLELSSTALEASCRLNPMDAESWSQLAHNRRCAGDLAGAALGFERVLALSGRRDFAALTSLASVRREMGEPEPALAHLQAALAVGAPPSPSATAETRAAQHEAGMALMELGRHEDAGLVFEAVIDAEPDAAESWAALGVCLSALGQPEAALACQRQVLAIAAARVPARDESTVADAGGGRAGGLGDAGQANPSGG
jgi:hypothetical protein